LEPITENQQAPRQHAQSDNHPDNRNVTHWNHSGFKFLTVKYSHVAPDKVNTIADDTVIAHLPPAPAIRTIPA
jgi:hypothetical protein